MLPSWITRLRLGEPNPRYAFAGDCYCNVNTAPCSVCMGICETCDGDGIDRSEIGISVTLRGKLIVIIGDYHDCPDCDGYGSTYER